MRVEEVANHQEEGVIGGDQTLLCFKSQNNYVIATQGKGCGLVREGETLYRGRISSTNFGEFEIYDDRETRSYFIHSQARIYQKKVDKTPPKLFFAIKSPEYPHISFNVDSRIMIWEEDKTSLKFLNKATKKVEFVSHGKYELFDLLMFTFSKKSGVGQYKRRMRAEQIKYKQSDSDPESSSDAPSSDLEESEGNSNYHDWTEICPSEKYRCSFTSKFSWDNGNYLSRLIEVKLFDISEGCSSEEQTKIASVSYENESIIDIVVTQCYGYFGDHLLFMALSGGGRGVGLLFDFNTKTGQFREVEEARCLNGEQDVETVHYIGGGVYYTGKLGKVIKIGLSKTPDLQE